MTDLTIKQGDTFRQTLTVTNRDGTPTNLTGVSLTAHFRMPGAAADLLTVALTIIDAVAGLAQLALTSTQTAALAAWVLLTYEVELVDTVGDIWTPVEGRVLVMPDLG